MPEARLEFSDNDLCRRYFAKFARVIAIVQEIAKRAPLGASGGQGLGDLESEIIAQYLARLAGSFAALSMKHLLTGLVHNRLPAKLEIDQADSGFPVFRELLALGDDGKQAQARLAELPDRRTLKGDIIDYLLKHKSMPRDLQFAMSQRVYHEALLERPLFYARNELKLLPLEADQDGVLRYLAYWAVYDSQRNLPNIYLMVLDSSHSAPLASEHDLRRRVVDHLLAQSLSSLKLVTIATGFDQDFPELHPKLIKRIHVGPLYANRFTKHADVIQRLLAEAEDEAGQDWVFCWTVESLFSKASEWAPSGMFGETQKEIYHVDLHDPEAFEAGASAVERAMILPYRPYQRLVEGDFEQLKPIRKYVVGPDGMLLDHV